MNEFERTVVLPFPPSANTAYATDWRTRRRYKGKAALVWEPVARQRCALAFDGWDLPPDAMLAMTFRFAFPDARRADAQNYIKLPCDVIVAALGLDDNQFVLPFITIESMGISKESPKCMVTVRIIGHVVHLAQVRRRKRAA